MSEDPLSNFGCLDELTQVIYQSVYKFVVLSTVSNNKWNIHVGLAGCEGRWWRGCWTEDDIRQIFGSKSSDKLLESFAEKLAEVFIQGELCISDWSAEKGAKIKFTLGPASKKPMHVDLVEMSPEEGAAFATGVFIDIALQAQSRKCRLYPSSSTEYRAVQDTFATTSRTTSHTVAGPSKPKEPSPEPERPSKRSETSASAKKETKKSSEVEAAQAEIKALKSQLQTARRGPSPAQKPAPVRPHKGASLANPNKKARKYQAIEFGSDDE
ncbi:hypothetical protein NLJ89_g6358 [Agrocybe chaxingu]|uniref:Uncharacterized protein n=1 Tax=Agrocybe chaxingu TaxID=84603 RepID=A0A9W8K0X5_9AGAR|nr:hypothetical protein NLJ89_g6358 [Agrocybe chaxingu]